MGKFYNFFGTTQKAKETSQTPPKKKKIKKSHQEKLGSMQR